MAKVWKRVRPRDGKPDLVTWEARWREPDSTQRRRAFTKKSDAERFLTTIEVSLHAGSYVSPARSRVTVGDYAELWLAGRTRLKPTTLVAYRKMLDNHVLPRWGAMRLDQVRYEDVTRWVADKAQTIGPPTVRQAYYVLTAVLNEAVRAHRLPANPAKGVEMPRLRTVGRRYLTHQQVMDLADECGGSDGLVVLTLAYTGVRWGEMAAIRVHRVAPGARRILIAETMTLVRGTVMFGPPKTHAERWVGVPAFMRDQVLAQAAGRRPDDLLFPSPNGAVLRVNGFRRRFDKAAARVGLPGLVPHELRHTAASLAIAEGADVKSVQAMLGHSSAAMTLDRYSHLFDTAIDDVADRLDAARARVSPVCPQPVDTPRVLADTPL